MSFANPLVLLDGDREIIVVVRTTTCSRPRPQLPPDFDVGDDDSDSLPSKGSFSATLRVEEDIDLPDVPPCSVSCVEERARRQDSPGGGVPSYSRCSGTTFFQVLQTALAPTDSNPSPLPKPQTQVPTKRRVKRPEKEQKQSTNERKVRLLIVASSPVLHISPPRSYVLFGNNSMMN